MTETTVRARADYRVRGSASPSGGPHRSILPTRKSAQPLRLPSTQSTRTWPAPGG